MRFLACESSGDHKVKLDAQKNIAGPLCDAVGGIIGGFAMKPCLDAERPMRRGLSTPNACGAH